MEGAFQKAASNPFADVTPHMTDGALCPVPIFVDWDGDGSIDLVLTGTDKVQYFPAEGLHAIPSILPTGQMQWADLNMRLVSSIFCFPSLPGMGMTHNGA